MDDEPVPSSWNVICGLERTKKVDGRLKKDEYQFQVYENKWFYQLDYKPLATIYFLVISLRYVIS